MILRSIAALSAAAFLAAGCARGPEPAPAPGAPSGAAPEKPAAVQTDCAHPYYPLKPGYTVTYTSTVSGKPTSHTMTVTEAKGTTVKTLYTFEGSALKMDQTLSCDDGAIRALSYLDLGSVAAGKQATAVTKTMSGELLPRDLRVGSEWTSTFIIEMQMNIPGLERAGFNTATGTVTAIRKAVAEVPITVAAGSYTALKVESTTMLDIATPGLPRTVSTTMKATEYWVKNVGLVKTESTGDAPWSMEASSVTVP